MNGKAPLSQTKKISKNLTPTLKITTKEKQDKIKIDNKEYTPAYNLSNASVFLYDLKKVTPDSITIEKIAYPLYFVKYD